MEIKTKEMHFKNVDQRVHALYNKCVHICNVKVVLNVSF